MRRTARPKPNKNYSGGVNLERCFISISRVLKTAWLQRKMETLKMIEMLSVVGGSGEWNYIDIHCSAWKRWCWGPDWWKIIIYALGLFFTVMVDIHTLYNFCIYKIPTFLSIHKLCKYRSELLGELEVGAVFFMNLITFVNYFMYFATKLFFFCFLSLFSCVLKRYLL